MRLQDIKFQPEVFSDVAVWALCDGGVSGLSQPQSKGAKVEPPPLPPPAEPPAQPPAKPPAQPPAQPVPCPEAKPAVPLPPARTKAESTVTAVAAAPQSQAKIQKDEEPDDEDQMLVSVDMLQRASQLVDDRQAIKETLDRERRAKRVLKKSGLDFNETFQKAHRGKEWCSHKGHWKTFLDAIMGEKEIDCSICQALVQKYNIDRLSEDLVLTPPKKKTKQKVQDDQNTANPQQPEGTLESPPKKRARAGRPKRDQGPAFDLIQYLEEKRPGMYRFLEYAEAVERLPKDKQSKEEAIAREMAKKPVQCMGCGVYFHLPYLTNNLALSFGHISKCTLFYAFQCVCLCLISFCSFTQAVSGNLTRIPGCT